MRGPASAWIHVAAWGLLSGLLVSPAAAQLPPAVAQAVATAERECREAGGRPSPGPQFQTSQELNGDGEPDWLLDYTHLNCAGAEGFFCGAAGCPLVLFLSGARRFAADPLGHVQGWSVQRGAGLPVLILQTGRGAVRLAWNGREMARAAAGTPPRQAAPLPTPATPPAAAGGKAPAAPGSAWQSRATPGGTMAMGPGAGVVRAVSVLCHAGTPVVALTLRAQPPPGPVTAAFAGRAERASLPLQQLGRGETWIGDLRGTPLPRLLAGGEAGLDIAINGGRQGRLNLEGAAGPVRDALAGCHGF
ncbi:hypothetical protein [Falsiroseomonas sp. HW251]|uniref:hypothetical protein n=1 Tax=Falsiroseomonas sp. HW251 TaxID=3390998 RepID=UPI003D317E4E